MENFVYQALGAHQGLVRIGDQAASDWPKTAAFWPMWLTKMTIGSHIYEWLLCNQLGCATSVRRRCEWALKETQVVKIRCYHVSQVRRLCCFLVKYDRLKATVLLASGLQSVHTLLFSLLLGADKSGKKNFSFIQSGWSIHIFLYWLNPTGRMHKAWLIWTRATAG